MVMELTQALPPELVPNAPTDVEPGRWHIDGTGTAEWALRKLAKAKEAVRVLDDQVAEWQAPITEWWERAVEPLQREIQFFEGELKRYALDVRAENPEMKSLSLPSGTVQTRSAAPHIELDEREVLNWAAQAAWDVETYAEVVQLKLNRSAFMKLAQVKDTEDGPVLIDKESGEVIPGATVTYREPTATVQVGTK